MKRSDLTVGMTVEDKHGREFVVVDAEGWIETQHYVRQPTGRSWGSHAIVARGYQAPPDFKAQGVLVVNQKTLGMTDKDETVGGEILNLRSLFPAGHKAAAIRERQASLEAQVDAQEKRDRELVEQVQRYWSDVPHLIATCGVTIDGGLLTEKERAILVTMILTGQNR